MPWNRIDATPTQRRQMTDQQTLKDGDKVKSPGGFNKAEIKLISRVNEPQRFHIIYADGFNTGTEWTLDDFKTIGLTLDLDQE